MAAVPSASKSTVRYGLYMTEGGAEPHGSHSPPPHFPRAPTYALLIPEEDRNQPLCLFRLARLTEPSLRDLGKPRREVGTDTSSPHLFSSGVGAT